MEVILLFIRISRWFLITTFLYDRWWIISLFSPEALYLMILHTLHTCLNQLIIHGYVLLILWLCVLLTIIRLYETHHRLVTFAQVLIIKCFIVRFFKEWDVVFIKVIIGQNLGIYVILEIGQESSARAQVNIQGLVIKGEPFACLRHVWVWCKTFGITSCTKLSLHFSLWEELNFPDVLTLKGELMVLFYGLNPVWYIMGTYFFCLEQVYSIDCLAHMEVPIPVQLVGWGVLFANAVHR